MTADDHAPAPPAESDEPDLWILRVFGWSRFFVVLAALGTFLSSIALFIFGTLVVAKIIWETLKHGDISVDEAKHLQVSFIEMTDVFLLGTVLIIVALGLYQLFIEPRLPVPHWLRIRSLDQLTAKLIEVVSVLLGVTFLAFAVELGSGANVLDLGIAVALVIVALAIVLVVSHHIFPPHAD